MKLLVPVVFVSLAVLASVGAQDVGSVLLGVGLGIAKAKVFNALVNNNNGGFRNNNGFGSNNRGFRRRNGFGGGGRRRGGNRRNNGDLVIRLGRSVDDEQVDLADKYVESLERAVLADADNCMKKLVCNVASKINFEPVSVSD